MTVVWIDPDSTAVCESPDHTTAGRGPGLINIDGAWWCAFEAYNVHGYRPWSSGFSPNNEHVTGVELPAVPADIGGYDGPFALNEIGRNNFRNNTLYDIVLTATETQVSVRVNGSILRGSAAERQRVANEAVAAVERLGDGSASSVELHLREV